MTVPEHDGPPAQTMRSNPDEPRRITCPRCREPVLEAGKAPLMDWREVTPQARRGELPAGLYVALSAGGSVRPLRLPGGVIGHGEAVHRLHELECQA